MESIQTTAGPEVIWTAKAIADLTNLQERQVFHAVKMGQLPGAFRQGKKIGLHVATWREGVRTRAVK
jgi:hypothetical protein